MKNNTNLPNLIKFIYKRVTGDWLMLILGFLALIITALIDFKIPQITKNIIDDVIPNKDMALLMQYVLLLIIFAASLSLLNFISTYVISKVSQKAITSLKEELFQHTIYLDSAYFEDSKTGDLMERFGSDVRNLQDLISANTLARLSDILTFTIVYIFMLRTDAKLTLMITVTLPLIFFVNRFFNKKIKSAYRKVRSSSSKLNNTLLQSLSTISLVKNSCAEDFELEQFSDASNENTEMTIEAIKLQAIYSPLIEFINYIGLAIVLWYGSYLVIGESITVGILISYISYLKMLQSPIKSFSSMINRFQQALVSYERIQDLMLVSPTIKNSEQPVHVANMNNSIVFDDVSFSYTQGGEVLNSINFEIPRGKMTALVGSSGSGKTSITKLITRLYDVSSGNIYFDGTSIKDIDLSDLRNMVAIVTQNVELIDGSIKENILYGNSNSSIEELEQAIDKAALRPLIDALEQGYDTQIGERGLKLSGGERQRIAIARAFLKGASILILDEATASLDNESELHIQESLNKLMVGRTSLVIAHRLSTIHNADNILVLEYGKIVESGNHQELIEQSGRYSSLYKAQFK